MSISIKKTLLTGTALVAVSLMPQVVQAATHTVTGPGSVVWASTGAADGSSITKAKANDLIVFNAPTTATVIVTNNGVASDGSGNVNTFTIAKISDSSTGKGSVSIYDSASSTGPLSVAIGEISIKGDMTVTHDNAADFNQTVNITNGATIGGTFNVTNNDSDGGQAQLVTVGGALTVAGATNLTVVSGAGMNSNLHLQVGGNASFLDTVTISGGSNVGTTATLTLKGVTNNFGGTGLVFGASNAELVLDGTLAQTVNGDISGSGVLIVQNAAGATFTGNLSGLLGVAVADGAAASSATFKGDVDAAFVQIGDSVGANTNTVTFDSATNGTITISAAVVGGGSDVANVVVTGGGTVKTTSVWGGSFGLNSITVNQDTIFHVGDQISNITKGITIASADSKVIVDSGVDLSTGVDATANGFGTLIMAGGNQVVSGQIGATGALALVEAGNGGTTEFVAFMNANTVKVGNGVIKLNGLTGNIDYQGLNGTVIVEAGADINGNVDNSTGSGGTLTLASGNSTVTGTVGATGALAQINAGTTLLSNHTFQQAVKAAMLNIGGGVVNLNGGLTGAVDFGGNGGTLNLAAGQAITGNIDNSVGSGGTLSLLGGNQTIGGTVGATGGLTAIIAGVSGGTSTFLQHVNASTIGVGDGTVNLNGGLTGGIDYTGMNGTVNVGVGSSVTGTIDNNLGGTTGTLNLLGGTQMVGGAVGTIGPIAQINLGATGANTTFAQAVRAAAIDVLGNGTVNFNDSVQAALDLNGLGGTVNMAGVLFDGTIDNSTGAGGVLNMTGGLQQVTGAIGATGALAQVNAGATGASTNFASNVKANVLNVTGTGSVVLGGGLVGNAYYSADGSISVSNGESIVGAIDAAANNMGVLTFAGSGSVTGTVGGANALKIINAGNVSGVTTFDSYVRAATLNIGNGTVNLNGFTGNADFGNNVGTLNLASGTGVSGNIDNVFGIGGTLNLLGGNQVVTGDVGATNSLGIITGGVANGVATFMKTVTAGVVDVLSTGTINFMDDLTGDVNFVGDGTVTLAGGKTLTGNVDNSFGMTPTGTMIFGGDAVVTGTIGASFPLKGLTLNGTGGTTGTNGAGWLVDVQGGGVNLAQTTTLNGNTLAVSSGGVSTQAGQTINTTLTGAVSGGNVLTGGNIVASGPATIAAGTNVDVNMQVQSYVQDGAVLTLVDGAGGAGVGAVNITDNSFLFSFTQGASTSDLEIIAHRQALASIAQTQNQINVANALDTIGGGVTGSLLNVQIALQNATTQTQFVNILERLLPNVNESAVVSVLNVGGVVNSIVETRMAELRLNGSAMTGMAAGYDDGYISGENVWFQAYGQSAKQDDNKDIKGYKSTTVGAAFGVDSTNIWNGAVVGLAMNYARLDADSENITRVKNIVDNFGLNLYASHDLGEEMFINGQLGYGYNRVTNDRYDVVAVGDKAHGSYDGHQVSAKMALGSDLAVDYATTMTPSLSLDYSRLSTGAYEESGIGTAGLNVDTETYSTLKLGVGLATEWNLRNYDGSILKPVVRVGYAYDLKNDAIQTTSTFIGDPSGTTFVTQGVAPSRSTFNVGGGLTYMTTANWDLSANYDFTYRSAYTSHVGVARATARF